MQEDQEEPILHTHWLRCPSCFKSWYETHEQEQDISQRESICEFCCNDPTSLELLHRRVEVMNTAPVNTMPVLMAHLMKHVELKE